ncbi:MAG: hypothetical protein K2X09_07020 [Rickettsiales bacterium]|nr:hypothetical protein [Rickettsiales bacterium]
MTDTMPPTTAKKRSPFMFIAGGILLVALIGFFASRAGLDKALVKQQLDDFIAQVKEKGKAQGRDIEITYGELQVIGSFTAKHVVVHDPVLTIQPTERKAPRPGQKPVVDALRITTPSIEIFPEALDLSALRIQLPAPIHFVNADTPETSLLSIKNNVPPVVTISHKKLAEVLYTDVKYLSPSEMEFTYLREQQAKGAEDKTPEIVPVYDTLTIRVAQGSGFSSSVAGDGSGLGEASIDMRDIVMTPKSAPEGAINIAQIIGQWSNALNDKNLNVLHGSLKAGPITSENTTVPYLPIALDFDATYEGAMPKNAEAIASIQSPESLITLKQFSLTTKESSLKAAANFRANASDKLPVGTANITLVNAPFVLQELRKYQVVNPANETTVANILQLLTGTPAEQLTDVTIAIERTRGGSFKIGKTTFEELFAVLLKEALQKRPAVGVPPAIVPAPAEDGTRPLVPTLPPADKPKSVPIEIPDQGVRG